MARQPKATPPGEGHNKAPGLSQADKDALLVHHITALAAQKAAVAEAYAPYKEANEAFTTLINDAKKELGKRYTRKRLVGLLEDRTARLRDILREEEERFQDRIALGLPIYGQQADLFGDDKTPAEAKDALAWEAEGYLLGRRGADPDIADMPPRFKTNLMTGWHRGQEENGKLLAAAGAASRAKAAADAVGQPVLTADEPEPEDDDPDLDAAARKLKAEGWTAPTADETVFEPA